MMRLQSETDYEDDLHSAVVIDAARKCFAEEPLHGDPNRVVRLRPGRAFPARSVGFVLPEASRPGSRSVPGRGRSGRQPDRGGTVGTDRGEKTI